MAPPTQSIGPFRYHIPDHVPFYETRMSLLWQAEALDTQQRKLGEKVVLKVARLKEEQFSLANQRAIDNEERWLRQLQHPGIIKLRPIAEEGTIRPGKEIYRARSSLQGNPWFVVTDYLPGGTLQSLVEKHKKLSTHLALQIARSLAETLSYIHAQGCVHRDFKPQNILFAHVPPNRHLPDESRPILIDFGIANHRGDQQLVSGTPPWLPLECAQAHQAGTKLAAEPSMDMYALGLMLYFMLTGQRPPDATPALATQVKIPAGLLVDIPVNRRATVADALNRLMQRTLEDQPSSRLTAAQFVNEIDPLLAQTTPSAAGWFSRQWAWVGSAVAAVAISVILFNRADPPVAPPTPVASIATEPPIPTPSPILTLPATSTLAPTATAILLPTATAPANLGATVTAGVAAAVVNTLTAIANAAIPPTATHTLPAPTPIPPTALPTATATPIPTIAPPTATFTPIPTTAVPTAPPTAIPTTALPTPIPTPIATTRPTIAPTATQTPTALPQATATFAPSATPTATNTRRPTLVPTNTLVPPTATPAPTNTALPVNTPTPVPSPTAINTVAPTRPPLPAPAAASTLTLNEPLSGVLAGRLTFRWTTNTVLQGNQAFEMIFWVAGQDPLATGFSPVGANTATSVTVDLDKFAASEQGSRLLVRGREYEWGVRLVELNPFTKLRYLGGGHRFRYGEESGNNGGSNPGGDDRPEPPAPKPTNTPRG